MTNENPHYERITLSEFVRLIAADTDSPYAFFLGAGASISSGIPGAESLIRKWKWQLFESNNPEIAGRYDGPGNLAAQQAVRR